MIVNVGHKRKLDLAVEVPASQLGPIATNEMWDEIYDRLVELIEQHRSTLVFVNTRRLSERISHHLAEKLGPDNVAAHHGSLSRKLRLAAEKKLKDGEVKVLVATASLELGIDIGTVDLVVQISSPRAIAVALQRVGRSGHWRGAVPKGRFFVTTRDELQECAALVRAIRQGDLDRIMIPDSPLDILAQQIVAICAAGGGRVAGTCPRLTRENLRYMRAVASSDTRQDALHTMMAGTKTSFSPWCAGRIRIAISHAKLTKPFSKCSPRALHRAEDATARTSIAIASIASCERGAARGWRQSPAAAPSPKPRCLRWSPSPKELLSARSTKTLPSRAMPATSCCWATVRGEFAGSKASPDACS